MKFLCEQCKAKYQIADDKVAGKTVRMKCRKCGFMIEVSADVTETSVAQGLPQEDGAKKAPPKPAAKLATSLTGRPPPPKGKPDALAGAFQRKVRQDAPESTASLDMLDSAATNGWYAAINGVPVGPIRISELRRKAANGAINEDSLVWREGLEEWRPVRSVTELAEIVREAMSSGRPSLATPPPVDVRPSNPPPAPSIPPRAPARPQAPRAPEPRPPERSNSPDRHGQPLAARSNVVPFTGRLATAEKRDELEDIDVDEDLAPSAFPAPPAPAPAHFAERPSLVTADPFAVPGAPLAPTPPPAAVYASQPVAGSSPFAMPGPAVATAAVDAQLSSLAQPPARKAPVNPIVIGMILAFIAFGVTAAFLFFKPAPQAPEVKVITVPVPMGPTATPMSTAQTPEVAPTEKTPEKTPASKTGAVAQVGKTPAPTTAPQPGPGKIDVGGLLGGSGGPDTRPGQSTQKPTSALDAAAIESTVRSYAPGVKRTCWERANSQISSVNINAEVTVASTGQVQNVRADGNEPTVAKCIENQVHNWKFPASSGTTTVNIPFKFVRQ
ncbi:MAG: zinc-ribbon domain-containing protein [Myxococcales bacterium]|nr:zinc-ribbon domain-containing protein [Myxococcales bacterium]